MDSMKPTSALSLLNSATGEPKAFKLLQRDYSVLRPCKQPNLPLDRLLTGRKPLI
jgi:hypothetical protein